MTGIQPGMRFERMHLLHPLDAVACMQLVRILRRFSIHQVSSIQSPTPTHMVIPLLKHPAQNVPFLPSSVWHYLLDVSPPSFGPLPLMTLTGDITLIIPSPSTPDSFLFTITTSYCPLFYIGS